MEHQIEPYNIEHKAACLAIFKSNMPKYFAEKELPEFIRWLENGALTTPYFIVKKANQIVACGGYYYDSRYEKGGLSWGMVDAALHGQGIGKQLTQYRIQHMIDAYPKQSYMIETSQHTFQFYEKLGFVIEKITPDGFSKGLDNYLMVLKP